MRRARLHWFVDEALCCSRVSRLPRALHLPRLGIGMRLI
jgi:hypothetical protein